MARLREILNTRPAATGLILLLMLIWAFSYIIIKVTVSQGIIPPMSLAFLRFAVACAALYAIRIPGPRPGLRDRAVIALMGIMGMALYFTFENYGLVYTTATNASILVALIPALTTAGAALFFRERFTAANMLGLVVAFAASALIVWNGKVNFHLNPLGDVLILLSVVVWTAYTLAGRDILARWPAALVARESLVVATACLLPFFVVELRQGKLAHVTPAAAAGVVYLGLFCTALAYTIWGHGVRVLGPVYASNMLYLQSALTMVCAWATIREPITLLLVGCTAALILGVSLSNRPPANKRMAAAPRLK